MEPPPECRQETPALTEAAAKFLNFIGPEDLERCLFAEMLEVVAAGDQPRDGVRGRWWVSARWAPYKQTGEPVRSCLLVQAASRRRQDGVLCSSTLKAYVTTQLETLEQEEQERLELRAHPIEKRTHMVSHQHGMTITKTLREGEAELQCWSFSYGRDELQGLMPEGASLLLLRVLACRWAVPPGLVFPAIDTEGHLCTSSYHALGTQQQAVGSSEVEVFVIERAVHASAGTSTIWHSSFLPSGYGQGSVWGHPQPCQPGRDPGEGVSPPLLPPPRRLARQVQVGSPVMVLLQDESVLGGVEPRPLFPKQPLDWEEDVQLYSWFLDRKEELQASHTAYVRQHPELWALLADFLQALFLHQPHDPVSFAAQFFTPFAHQQPPGTRFASARAASPLPGPPPRHPPANGE
ncbi:ciliogenesis-associated TTC17-interacting protein isoform X2 [Larus michahellis]|uniref:ciliogenesis-associated TTC17-interacting protein isoform X2 n=1 Tax=Larus michahellis TaxID=119627 RepID=UPI003D9BD08F